MIILKRLKSIFEEMNFLGKNCAIDSLMRIEDDNFDRCTSGCDCYYDKSGVVYIKLCSSLIEEDLREVR